MFVRLIFTAWPSGKNKMYVRNFHTFIFHRLSNWWKIFKDKNWSGCFQGESGHHAHTKAGLKELGWTLAWYQVTWEEINISLLPRSLGTRLGCPMLKQGLGTRLSCWLIQCRSWTYYTFPRRVSGGSSYEWQWQPSPLCCLYRSSWPSSTSYNL